MFLSVILLYQDTYHDSIHNLTAVLQVADTIMSSGFKSDDDNDNQLLSFFSWSADPIFEAHKQNSSHDLWEAHAELHPGDGGCPNKDLSEKVRI